MIIEEIVMYPTQLVHVETTFINAKKLSESVSNEFNISAKIKGEVINENVGKSIINISVQNNGYQIEEEKVGIFKFEKEIDDVFKAQQFMEVQGARIMWSYLREDLYTISSKMLPKPIMIPTIDVMRTLEKAQ
ncbi:MAG: hypothetical protein K2G55_18860 [Lachnospiraceae bacterium]|nr:hypothetical protein [Lachnospiraceae bacterium]MDE7200629.1 hypothetical protein [Lachnospiraceae bacterium]